MIDLYLKRDVLLIADVFEKLINTCLDYYGLDLDTHIFIEKIMRGGISYIAKRHSKANNK